MTDQTNCWSEPTKAGKWPGDVPQCKRLAEVNGPAELEMVPLACLTFGKGAQQLAELPLSPDGPAEKQDQLRICIHDEHHHYQRQSVGDAWRAAGDNKETYRALRNPWNSGRRSRALQTPSDDGPTSTATGHLWSFCHTAKGGPSAPKGGASRCSREPAEIMSKGQGPEICQAPRGWPPFAQTLDEGRILGRRIGMGKHGV